MSEQNKSASTYPADWALSFSKALRNIELRLENIDDSIDPDLLDLATNHATELSGIRFVAVANILLEYIELLSSYGLIDADEVEALYARIGANDQPLSERWIRDTQRVRLANWAYTGYVHRSLVEEVTGSPSSKSAMEITHEFAARLEGRNASGNAIKKSISNYRKTSSIVWDRERQRFEWDIQRLNLLDLPGRAGAPKAKR